MTKTKVPGVDWLLDCEPREAQLEALARSYTGLAYRDSRDGPSSIRALPHRGRPAEGWGHFMEMRVGKTPTLLNEYLLLRRDYGIKKAFVMAPNKYKGTWLLEAERFGILDIPLHVFDSTGREDCRKFLRDAGDEWMVFLNYEALVSDTNMSMFTDMIDDRTLFVADESVYLKNRQASMTKRAMGLAKAAAITRPMSGKPVVQGVHDLYSQLRLCRTLEGVNFFQFRNTYAVMGGFKGKKIIGVQNVERLDRLRFNHSFFARRADWGLVIEPDYEIVNVAMNEHQSKAYATMEDEFIVWLESGGVVSADQIITKHMKLQQISSGFIIDEWKNINWLTPFTSTPKFKDLQFRLEEQTTDKAIIVFHYAATGDALLEALKHLNPATIRGQQYMDKVKINVDAEKRRFNSDPRCRVLIAQSQAVKYGHTLMGSGDDPCLTTIFYENSYSLDTRSQVEQRNQGEGQKGPINLVDYCSSPIEKVVIKALQDKEEVVSKIMGYYKAPAIRSYHDGGS